MTHAHILPRSHPTQAIHAHPTGAGIWSGQELRAHDGTPLEPEQSDNHACVDSGSHRLPLAATGPTTGIGGMGVAWPIGGVFIADIRWRAGLN